MNARAQPSARSISPSGKVATLKAIIFLLAALVAQGVGLADAASVTRTESGGIVISAYGERMSFKEGDAGRTVFNFVGSNCDSNKRAFLITPSTGKISSTAYQKTKMLRPMIVLTAALHRISSLISFWAVEMTNRSMRLASSRRCPNWSA
jgi:hypothetical protein